MLRHLLLLSFCLIVQSCGRPDGADDARPPHGNVQTKLAAHGGLEQSAGVKTATAASSDRQISMAKAFHDAGLLSDAGFKRVMAAQR